MAGISISQRSPDGEDCYKVQLPLPFEEACSLEKDKKLRLLRDQASRIPDLQQWEIDAFIELCELKDLQQKNNSPKFSPSDCVWLDRGLAIIYEYSGFIDEYHRTASKLILLHTIAKEYTVSSSLQTDSKQTLLQLISTSVFFIGRAINIISNWRRLQSTPRLMLLLRNNDRDIDQNNQSNSTWHLITNVCSSLFELIKLNASNDHEKGGGEVERNIGTFLKFLTTELSADEIALLLSPIMEYSQFSSLLRFERSFELCPPMQYSIHHIDRSINEDEIFVTYNHTRKFLTMEKSFLDAYQGDKLLARAMIERLPTFRLPYNPPAVSHLTNEVHLYDLESGNPFKWFPTSSTYALYEQLGKNFRFSSSSSQAAAESVHNSNTGSKPSEMQRNTNTPKSVTDLRSYTKPLILPSLSPLAIRKGSPSSSPVQNRNSFVSLEEEQTFGRRYTDSTEATGASDVDTVGLRSSHNVKSSARTIGIGNAVGSPRSDLIRSRTQLAPIETSSTRNSKSSESPTTTNSQIFSPIAIGRQPNFTPRDMVADLQRSKSAKNGLSQKSKMLESSMLLERRLLRAVEIISRWWLHYLPRRRLLYRMELRNMALSIIQEISSTVYRIAVSRQKQRKHLLQYGCACKIQTLVRRYLSRRLRLRTANGSSKIKKLKHQVERLVLSKAEEKRSTTTTTTTTTHPYSFSTIANYWYQPHAFHRCPDHSAACAWAGYQEIRRLLAQKTESSHVEARNFPVYSSVEVSKVEGQATESVCDNYSKVRSRFGADVWRIRLFGYAFAALKSRVPLLSIVCVTWCRKSISSRVKLGLGFLFGGTLCHPIFSFFLVQLHMVSENDFAVIIETRKPQFVYTSEPYDITDDNKAADIMTGGCNIRRLPKEDVDFSGASNLPRSGSHRSKKAQPPMRQLRYMRVSAMQRKLDAAERGKLQQKEKKEKKRSGDSSGHGDDDDDDNNDDDNEEGTKKVEQDNLITKSAALSAFGLTRERSMYSFIYHNIQDRVARKATNAQEATKNRSRADLYKFRSPTILPSALLKIQRAKSIRSVGPSGETSVEKPSIESSNESPNSQSADATDMNVIVRPTDRKSALTAQQRQELLRMHSNQNMMMNRQGSGRIRQSSLSRGIIAPRVSISAAGARNNDNVSRRPSSGGLLLNRASHMVRKSIQSIGSLVSRASISHSGRPESSRKMCDFKDEKVKIPGCHGNSVVQFEILEGEVQRKIGTSLFCMSQQNDLMFWGGEYRDELKILKPKRMATMPLKAPLFPPSGGRSEPADELGPVLEFKITGGAARKSRCQWSRVMVLGKGPLRAIMRSRGGFWQSLFENWERFYLSIDEDGLGLYENKFSLKPVHCIPLMDFKDLYCELGLPVDHTATGSGKRVMEDFHTTILVTFSGDEIYMRFPDQNSVLAWQDSIDSAIQFCQKERTRIKRKRAVIGLPRLSLYSQPSFSSSSSSSSSLHRHSTGSIGKPNQALGNVVSIGRELVSLPSSSSFLSISQKVMTPTTTLPLKKGEKQKEEDEDS
eukprot:gene21341-27649_t